MIRQGLCMEKTSESLEMYLETMYLLEKTGRIRSVDIANKLNVSKPSVNKAVNVLRDMHYITQESYGDIQMTDLGRQAAEKIYERHLILNDFLQKVLEVPADIAESDACKMEHILSDITITQIKKKLEEHNR